MLPFKWFSPQSAEVVCREWVGRWVFWVGGGTEGDWRAGRQTDGGKLPQNDIARGSGSAQRIRMEFSRAGWSEISRLWDTGLVHTTSSGLREVPDFIELMSLARQSLPLRAKNPIKPGVSRATGFGRWRTAVIVGNSIRLVSAVESGDALG
jgi:hypothetical protein